MQQDLNKTFTPDQTINIVWRQDTTMEIRHATSGAVVPQVPDPRPKPRKDRVS